MADLHNLKHNVKKILLVKHRNIGDVLLTVPTIRVLRDNFPDAYIAMLVNSGTEDVIIGNPLLDEVMVFDQKWKELSFFIKAYTQMAFVMEIRKKGFDLVINMTEGDRGALTALVSGAKYRVGYDPGRRGLLGKKYIFTHLISDTNQRAHIVEQNLDTVRALGITPADEDKSVDIYYSDEDKEHIEEILAESGIEGEDVLIHIHPTSRWLFKCWRDEAVAEIIDYLQLQKGFRVVLTSGPDERELKKVEDILSFVKSYPLNLAGKTTIKQLAALTAGSNLFFGVDTAPMHIAAAVGTPVVALFGPSGEFNWGPWGKGHVVIKKDMECRPCGRDGCNGSKKSKCLEIIETAEVKKVIDEQLRLICGRAQTRKRLGNQPEING